MSPTGVHQSNVGVRKSEASSVFQQEIVADEEETEELIVEQINVMDDAINESDSAPTAKGESNGEEPEQGNSVEVVDEDAEHSKH